MLKREKESVKRDNQARRERHTSEDVHTEDKTQHTSENCSSTLDLKMA
jgi:hypothetical protein